MELHQQNSQKCPWKFPGITLSLCLWILMNYFEIVEYEPQWKATNIHIIFDGKNADYNLWKCGPNQYGEQQLTEIAITNTWQIYQILIRKLFWTWRCEIYLSSGWCTSSFYWMCPLSTKWITSVQFDLNTNEKFYIYNL